MKKTVLEEGEAPPKRGKQKNYYGKFDCLMYVQIMSAIWFIAGVDNKKFLGVKPTASAIKAIGASNTEEDITARESVYDKYRGEIQFQFRYKLMFIIFGQDLISYNFRTSPNNINNICKGFFMDCSHLAAQFIHLSNAQDLTMQVEKNLPIQVGRFLRFIETNNRYIVQFRPPWEVFVGCWQQYRTEGQDRHRRQGLWHKIWGVNAL